MTQVWNSDDSFTFGAYASAGTSLPYYLRLVPWVTDTSYALGGTGFSYQVGHFGERGMLYNGWFMNTPPYAIPFGSTRYAAACSHGRVNQVSPEPQAFIVRGIDIAEAEVSASFTIRSTDGAYIQTNAVTAMLGVGARLRPSTVEDGADANHARVQGGDGYWFMAIHDAALGLKLELVRVKSSVVFRLFDTPNGSSTFAAWRTTLDLLRTLELKITTETVGGNVRIRGYTRNSFGPGSPAGYTLACDVTDSSVNKLTASGLCGLLLGSEYLLTTTPDRVAAPACNWFRIRTANGATTHLHDDWTRTSPINSRFRGPTEPSASQAHKPGRGLMSAWTGDEQSSAATPWLLANTTSDRVDVLAGSYPWIALSQRRADDPREQDRSVTAYFDSSGGASATERSCGLALRVSMQGNPTPAIGFGYALVLHYKDSTSEARIELIRYKPFATPTGYLATVIASVAGVAYVQATGVVLRLVVTTVGPDLLAGPARLTAYRNGVQVALVGVGVSGVDVSSGGVVTDSSSERVLSGYGEAVVAVSPTGVRAVAFDAWAQDVSAGPVEPPANDQPQIQVPAEYTTISGALPIAVEQVISVTHNDPRLIHRMESGHRYVGARLGLARRKFAVSSALDGRAALDSFLLAVETARGIEAAWSWNVPGIAGESIVVHIVPDTLVVEQVAPEAFTLQFQLQELVTQ